MKKVEIQGRQYEYNTSKALGRGTFGDVYRGVCVATREEVAVKVIQRVKMMRYGDEIWPAIVNEVKILQLVAQEQAKEPCPFIVKIFDGFSTRDHVYIVLEFCNGGNLQQVLDQQGRLSEEEAKYVLYQIVSAFDYLSRRGIAHRDLKPENVFIRDGIYKIGDFGFAAQKSLYATALGTPPYQAPEFFTQQNYGIEVDMWALGVMYHQMLFGELYFFGTSEREVKQKILSKPYIVQKAHLISVQSQDFLIRCIERDAQKRLNAQAAKNHVLFDATRNDQRIVAAIKATADAHRRADSVLQQQQQQSSQQQPSQQQDLSDAIVEQVSRARNATFFMVSAAERLEDVFNDICRFEAFYVLKHAVHTMTRLLTALTREEAPWCVEKYPSDAWAAFVRHEQYYASVVQLLHQDKEALFDGLMQHHDRLMAFVRDNFAQFVDYVALVVNLDALTRIDASVYYEQLQAGARNLYAEYQTKFASDPVRARAALLSAYEVKVCAHIDKIIVGDNSVFDFEEHANVTDTLTVQQIVERMQRIA